VWERAAQYCPLCSGLLLPSPVEGRERLRCSECEFVLYENPASASAGLVIDDASRILLVRRAIAPFRGAWALPAGYQEIDEPPETTVRREVLEETGIECRVLGLLDLLFVDDDPRKPGNVAIFLCEATGGELCVGGEEAEVGWFALDELPDEIGFDNSRRILERAGDPARYPDSPWSRLGELLNLR
jgi:8-oxo-dGTP diphosphatase